MDYVQAAKRGDIATVMDLSFDCVVCGLCMLRCPAEITQPLVGILAKRLYGRYLRKDSPELAERVKAVEDGAYDAEYAGIDVDEPQGFVGSLLRPRLGITGTRNREDFKMYPDYMEESLRKVAQTRPKRLELAKKSDPVYRR